MDPYRTYNKSTSQTNYLKPSFPTNQRPAQNYTELLGNPRLTGAWRSKEFGSTSYRDYIPLFSTMNQRESGWMKATRRLLSSLIISLQLGPSKGVERMRKQLLSY